MSDIIKDKKIEKAVKKLISEEWLASTFYEQMILACDPNERDTIADIFRNHANDEKYDHYEKLISFAISNTLEIPCKLQEYDRYSDESLVKLIEKFQKGKKANYYIEQAILSEQYAIQSYQEIINDENIDECLKRVILEIYYDELEHLSNLNSLLIAYNVGSKLYL